MERFTAITPGSFIEEKQYSLAWHYRNTRPETGSTCSGILIEEIRKIAPRQRIKIIHGKKVVEAIALNITKGVAVQYLINRNNYDYILAMGDDTTDEDMFRTLTGNDHAFTVKIGSGRTCARYKLKSTRNVMQLLNRLEASL
jgi:trehalose 6-phosphate synthase/phosphatase